MTQKFTIAVLGGSGQEGSGLALRWANAGHRVILGSRDAAKAAAAADAMKSALGGANVSGASNKDAAATADVIVLTVPYSAQRSIVVEVCAALAGKLLIDATVPSHFAVTLTAPPPLVASTVRAASAACACSICCCIRCACFINFPMLDMI